MVSLCFMAAVPRTFVSVLLGDEGQCRDCFASVCKAAGEEPLNLSPGVQWLALPPGADGCC